jgi:hypothetical protein
MTANGDELDGRLALREPSTLTEQQRALHDLIFAKSVLWWSFVSESRENRLTEVVCKNEKLLRNSAERRSC